MTNGTYRIDESGDSQTSRKRGTAHLTLDGRARAFSFEGGTVLADLRAQDPLMAALIEHYRSTGRTSGSVWVTFR